MRLEHMYVCLDSEPIITSTGSYMSLDTNGISPSLLSRDYKDPMVLCLRVDSHNTESECLAHFEPIAVYPQ